MSDSEVSTYDGATGFQRIDWVGACGFCLDDAEVTVGVVKLVDVEVSIGGFCMGDAEVSRACFSMTAVEDAV
eukprot:2158202-Ditylum_brightwellii.AAC.1